MLSENHRYAAIKLPSIIINADSEFVHLICQPTVVSVDANIITVSGEVHFCFVLVFFFLEFK